MARIRTIKPEFWKHEDLSELPPETHMLAAALLNYADDEGYFNANPRLIQAECCPLRDDSTSVRRGIEELSRIGYIRLFSGTDGKQYGHVVTFLTHQRVDRAKQSTIKGLEVSSKDRRKIVEESPQEGKGREEEQGSGKEINASVEQQFDAIMQSYPKREGSNPRRAALSSFKARLTEGCKIEDMAAGVARYLLFCQLKGWIKTGYVMQASRFFGPGKEFENDWEVNNANSSSHSGQQRLSRSDAAWEDYLAGTGESPGDYIDAEYAEVDAPSQSH